MAPAARLPDFVVVLVINAALETVLLGRVKEVSVQMARAEILGLASTCVQGLLSEYAVQFSGSMAVGTISIAR